MTEPAASVPDRTPDIERNPNPARPTTVRKRSQGAGRSEGIIEPASEQVGLPVEGLAGGKLRWGDPTR
jgi:hypothetical protein